MNEVKIMICSHKNIEMPTDEIYLTMQVGHALARDRFCYQTDDELFGKPCDNISHLNNLYCEMTGMYWAWKNIRNAYPNIKYVGLCHYRRYFYLKDNPIRDLSLISIGRIKQIVKIVFGLKKNISICDLEYNIESINSKTFIESNRNLKNVIVKHDIITTKRTEMVNVSVKDFFDVIGRTYIDITTKIIKESHEEILPYYLKTINGNKIYSANMIILRTDLLDEYCGFLFGVLSNHLAYVKDNNICSNPTQDKIYSRVLGYIAEILTSTYILSKRHHCKVRELSKAFIRDVS